MENKRMFSLDIVNDEKFLSMPASAQALYFHLGMRAGEYDFVSNPEEIARKANCSVDDLEQVCREIYRVLKPGGVFLFLEHGSASSAFFKKVQRLFNPLYNKYAYGCNITRTYQDGICNSGLHIVNLQTTHAPIYPRFLTGYVYCGIAEKPLT